MVAVIIRVGQTLPPAVPSFLHLKPSYVQYTFQKQNTQGQTVEQAHEILFTEYHILFLKNPWTGTADERRAWYDYQLGSLLLEVKSNPASNSTGNVAVEEDILQVSKAHYFSMAFITKGIWGAQVLDRNEVWELLNATSYTDTRGRFYKYPRVPAGQYKRTSMLVPVDDLRLKGVSLVYFLKRLCN